MLSAIIMISFALIAATAFYGDYEEKEQKEDYEKYDEIVRGKR